MARRISIALVPLLLWACGSPDEQAPPHEQAPTEEAVDTGRVPWIVSAAHPLAVDAGAKVLADGGSAADAAVAVQAVLGLVEPQSSGLAGGAFMLFYEASTGTLTAYDGRETAPASAHKEIFLREDGTPMDFFEAVRSGFSTGVPGAVSMLHLVHHTHGEKPWGELFGDAERLAADGFPMPVRMNRYVRRLASLREEPGASVYFGADGSPKDVGDTITNPDYANTVRLIAEDGPEAFYEGPIADAIIARVNAKTGAETLTRADFAAYEPAVREPICAELYAYKVCSMPPPSAGGTMLLQIGQMLEAVAGDVAPSDAWLAYIEASRLAYADRIRFIGDPSAMGIDGLDADELTNALISPDYVATRTEAIGNRPAETAVPGDPLNLSLGDKRRDDDAYEEPSTSHFSIRDSQGNIVSMTTTIEFPFGSQMMAAGMVLNNQLTDFSRTPGPQESPSPNEPGPGKRPVSSMTPVIAFDQGGAPALALGSPGGTAIIGYVAKPLLTHLATGKALSEAIAEPHVVIPRGSVTIEAGAEETIQEVEALGYEIRSRPLESGLYGFSLAGGTIDLAADPRREGTAKSALDD